jgi:hypothetical protein
MQVTHLLKSDVMQGKLDINEIGYKNSIIKGLHINGQENLKHNYIIGFLASYMQLLYFELTSRINVIFISYMQ